MYSFFYFRLKDKLDSVFDADYYAHKSVRLEHIRQSKNAVFQVRTPIYYPSNRLFHFFVNFIFNLSSLRFEGGFDLLQTSHNLIKKVMCFYTFKNVFIGAI